MRRLFQFNGLVLMMVLASSIAVGCDSSKGDNDHHRDRDRNRDWSNGATGVPRSATVEADGTGRLSCEVRSDGTVYLYDMQDRRVVDSQRVEKGQRYVADLDKDVATLDGRPVYEHNLERTHRHRIYFDKRLNGHARTLASTRPRERMRE